MSAFDLRLTVEVEGRTAIIDLCDDELIGTAPPRPGGDPDDPARTFRVRADDAGPGSRLAEALIEVAEAVEGLFADG